jgi:hypothetical protein
MPSQQVVYEIFRFVFDVTDIQCEQNDVGNRDQIEMTFHYNDTIIRYIIFK